MQFLAFHEERRIEARNREHHLMLPIQLRVEGRRCLVVGGGTVGTRRAKALIDAGADVVVVDPVPSAALKALAVGLPAGGLGSVGRVELLRRGFAETDVVASDDDAPSDSVDPATGLLLVVAATNDPAQRGGRRSSQACRGHGQPCRRRGFRRNRLPRRRAPRASFDQVSTSTSVTGAPNDSAVVNSAVVNTGSTGSVPALARWVARERLDEGVDTLLGLDEAGCPCSRSCWPKSARKCVTKSVPRFSRPLRRPLRTTVKGPKLPPEWDSNWRSPSMGASLN